MQRLTVMMLGATALMAAPEMAFGAGAGGQPVKNVVLVHGAWADSSGWRGVYDILTRDGYRVSLVADPLTSLADDVAATRRMLDRQDGPTILVAHSYGGAVITEAGDHPKVIGLVYVAAFAPDKGESVFGLYPKDTPQPPLDVTKDGFSFFREDAFKAAFAAGLPAKEAAFMYASQVPWNIETAGNAKLTVAAWRDKPSWYIVSGKDQIIPPDLERTMARRAGATVSEIDGGHLAFITDPDVVAQVIETAAKSAMTAKAGAK